MTPEGLLDPAGVRSVLEWAVRHQAAITASLLAEGQWNHLRSQFLRCDPGAGVFQILYPFASDSAVPAELAPGTELGIAFRRGHKKCTFVSPVLLRRQDEGPTGGPVDTLVLRDPARIREHQRRAYQRVTPPQECFIAVKLWQGGLPTHDGTTWPLCSGRLGNVSLGGILVDVREEHNPRLALGDSVGIEITVRPGQPPLKLEGQYRHCAATAPGRIGLGLQFLGLEHDVPGRSPIPEVAEFVRNLRIGRTG